MKNTSNNSDFDQLRMQMHCAKGSANELIEQGSGLSTGDDLRELIAWLQESQENRDRYDQLRELDNLIRDSVVSPFVIEGDDTQKLDADDFAERMKMQLDSFDRDSNSAETAETISDFQELFDQSDAQEQLLSESPGSLDSSVQPGVGSQAESEQKSRRPSTKWWIATAASLMVIALSITIAMMWETPAEETAQVYTAEMLCDQSLEWNPNKPGDFVWNQDIESAPADRLFPAHLIRHQAQSWRRMPIEGDDQAIVYNLVPEGHLSELKAYLYVFKTDRDYQLPSQFGSHPNANRKYKFWSLACQQDLVFVLVYEGDEKRLHELVKRQEVG